MSAVLQGMFGVMERLVLSPQAAFITIGPKGAHTPAHTRRHTNRFEDADSEQRGIDPLGTVSALRAVTLSKCSLECSKLVFLCMFAFEIVTTI